MGRSALRNGELLAKAEAGFDLLIITPEIAAAAGPMKPGQFLEFHP